MNKTAELTKLFKYVSDINIMTEFCVFFEVSAHVEYINIRLRKSKKEYDKELGQWLVDYGNYYDGKKRPVSNIKKQVDLTIIKIKEALEDSEAILDREGIEIRIKEIKRLKELTAKYPEEV